MHNFIYPIDVRKILIPQKFTKHRKKQGCYPVFFQLSWSVEFNSRKLWQAEAVLLEKKCLKSSLSILFYFNNN